MYIAIDGTEITQYIAHDGFKWTRNDIDASGSGRTMDGTMQRNRVATKIKLELKCRPLRKNEMIRLQNLLLPQYVNVTYDDFLYGRTTKVMYANNNSAEYGMEWNNGEEWIVNATFPLVER